MDAVDEHHVRKFAVVVQELHDFGVDLTVLFEVADFLVEDAHPAFTVLVRAVVLGGHHVLCTFYDVAESVDDTRYGFYY